MAKDGLEQDPFFIKVDYAGTGEGIPVDEWRATCAENANSLRIMTGQIPAGPLRDYLENLELKQPSTETEEES